MGCLDALRKSTAIASDYYDKKDVSRVRQLPQDVMLSILGHVEEPKYESSAAVHAKWHEGRGMEQRRLGDWANLRLVSSSMYELTQIAKPIINTKRDQYILASCAIDRLSEFEAAVVPAYLSEMKTIDFELRPKMALKLKNPSARLLKNCTAIESLTITNIDLSRPGSCDNAIFFERMLQLGAFNQAHVIESKGYLHGFPKSLSRCHNLTSLRLVTQHYCTACACALDIPNLTELTISTLGDKNRPQDKKRKRSLTQFGSFLELDHKLPKLNSLSIESEILHIDENSMLKFGNLKELTLAGEISFLQQENIQKETYKESLSLRHNNKIERLNLGKLSLDSDATVSALNHLASNANYLHISDLSSDPNETSQPLILNNLKILSINRASSSDKFVDYLINKCSFTGIQELQGHGWWEASDKQLSNFDFMSAIFAGIHKNYAPPEH